MACGFGLSLALLPNLYRAVRLEKYLPLLAVAAAAVFFGAFPAMLYTKDVKGKC
jgi:hypothetical protein